MRSLVVLSLLSCLVGCGGSVDVSETGVTDPACERVEGLSYCVDDSGASICGDSVIVPGASFAARPPNALPCPSGFACFVYAGDGGLVGQGVCQ